MAKKKVVVAMSGGVDSSLAAVLLKEQGYDLVGITLRQWSSEDDGDTDIPEKACCSLSSVEDARRIAQQLDIPYYVLNFRDAFQAEVVEPFVQGYLRGETPNPCVACNRHMRFDRLYRKAMELGADYVATGHYASVQRTAAGRHLLIRAKDRHKDQTYMLYTITQEQLGHTLYPLGGMDKSTTRAMAREYGLEVADKPDSQDICFIPGGDYKRFLRDYLPEEPQPGPMVMMDGHVIGQHTGITNYTIGQRKGIGLVWPRPLYVVDIQPETNTVVVGEAHDVFASELIAYDLNFIPFDHLTTPLEVEAKIRYGAIPAKAQITPLADGQRYRVEFAEPQRAITPGQAVVFYQGDIVVGGGTIARTQ